MPDRRILIKGFGNPAREDDGLGPEICQRVEDLALEGVTVDVDYQLSVEDAADVADGEVAIFVDASVDAEEPFSFTRLEPGESESISSHSISPTGVLGLAKELFHALPESYLLAIRGYAFGMFRETKTKAAAKNLEKAYAFIVAKIHELNGKTGGNR